MRRRMTLPLLVLAAWALTLVPVGAVEQPVPDAVDVDAADRAEPDPAGSPRPDFGAAADRDASPAADPGASGRHAAQPASGALDASLGAGPPPLNPYGPVLDVGGPPAPVYVGSGADALVKLPDLRGDAEPTLLERYGSQGHSLDSALGFGGETDRALNAVAGGLFAIAAWIAQAVIAVFQWAFTIEVFGFLGDAVEAIVGALDRAIYAPFVYTMVILAGLSMTWHGLVRRRSTSAAQAAAWTVCALTAAVVFLANPGAILSGANQLSTGLARGVLAGVSVADPKTGPDDGVATPAMDTGSPADGQLRIAGDRFWRVFIHQPWLVMQFGDLEAGQRYGEPLLAAKTITPEEYEEAVATADGLEALTEEKRGDYAALQEEVLADPRIAEWFRGRRSVERVGVASLALVGVLLGGVLLALVAAAVLLAQVGLLLLVLMGPIALLIGIHPGAGRLIALRWAELAVGLLVKRVALGALLAVVLVVSGVLLDATYPLGWLVVMGLQTLVVAAVVAYRKPFLRLIGPTTLPVIGVAPRSAAPVATEQRRELFRELRTRLVGAGAASTPERRPLVGARRTRRPAGAPTATAEPPPGTGTAVATPPLRKRRRVRSPQQSAVPDPAASADAEELLRLLVGQPPREGGPAGNGHGNGHAGKAPEAGL